jgi:hypothetical protein
MTRILVTAIAGGCLSCAALSALAASPTGKAANAGESTPAPISRHLLWEELIPKNWNAIEQVRRRLKERNITVVSDYGPHAAEIIREMRDVFDNAPINPEMSGVSGRLPGYIVPLDESAQGMKEFLLVPYFGACIHSPPPPANQIVHVFSAKRVKGFHSMDTVWVVGTLKTERGDSTMGNSAYRIDAIAVERYVRPAPSTDK